MTPENRCAFCGDHADHGLLCPVHRAEDDAIEAMAKEPANDAAIAEEG